MRRLKIPAATVGMLILSVSLSLSAQQRDLVEMRALFAPAPRTWSEAIDLAPVVARVKLLDRQYRVHDSLVITQYTAEVLEYVKADGAGSRTLQIYRLGGLVRDERGKETKYSVRGYPDFRVGEEYLVFLEWNGAIAAFSPRGPDVTFRLDRESGRVYTSGTSDFARSQNERTIASMMAHVRTSVH